MSVFMNSPSLDLKKFTCLASTNSSGKSQELSGKFDEFLNK